MSNQYLNRLIENFDEELMEIREPISLNTLFNDKEAYMELYDELYQEVVEDYNYRQTKLWITFNDKNFSMRVNSFIVHMIFWKPFLEFDKPFNEDFIVDTSHINSDVISNYLDLVIKYFITENNQDRLNNVISEIREELSWISLDFNPTIGNTINLYDKIQLAKRNERYNELIHTKLDENELSMEEIEKEIDTRTKELVGILKKEDNCFKDYLGSGEGINIGQLSQFEVCIGGKPDPKGRIFPKIINSNFLVGGLQSASDYFIDASGGRKASIINFSQVKVSGYMTRKLSLLCMNTVLDPELDDCGSTNYLNVTVDSKKTLNRLNGRYGILDGKEILIDKHNTDLIGKEIGLRSPVTCCSHNGKVCRKCYGELSKINNSIHIGVLGCQFLTEQQTQKMLSAKHLLKTNSESINWPEEFLEFFNVSSNNIGMNPSFSNPQAYTLVINEDDLDESGDSEFTHSLTKFKIIPRTGDIINIELEKELFISDYLEDLISSKAIKDDDGNYSLSMKEINRDNEDETLFFIEIENNELSKHLHGIINLIDQKDHLGCTTKEEVMQKFYDLVNEAGIYIDSVHLENILREILRDPYNLTKRPDWSKEEPVYEIMRVSDAIMNSSSISTSLSFEKIKKQLYEPETYEKVDDSFLDSLFK